MFFLCVTKPLILKSSQSVRSNYIWPPPPKELLNDSGSLQAANVKKSYRNVKK